MGRTIGTYMLMSSSLTLCMSLLALGLRLRVRLALRMRLLHRLGRRSPTELHLRLPFGPRVHMRARLALSLHLRRCHLRLRSLFEQLPNRRPRSRTGRSRTHMRPRLVRRTASKAARRRPFRYLPLVHEHPLS